MHPRQTSHVQCARWSVWVAAWVATLCVPLHVIAKQEAVSAAQALQRALDFEGRGSVGRAANWAERARVSPGASRDVRARASRLQKRLVWALSDSGYGAVVIHVTPADASVRIDGYLLQPVRQVYRVWLKAGSHQLVLGRRGFAPEQKVVTARAGEERTQRVSLTNTQPPLVTFAVQPKNAEVWVDRRFLGFAHRSPLRLPVGKVLLEVRAPGHAPLVKTMELAAGQRLTVNATLERDVVATAKKKRTISVVRKLTPLELANRGERHRLGKRPVDKASRTIFKGTNNVASTPESEAPPPPPPSGSASDDGDDDAVPVEQTPDMTPSSDANSNAEAGVSESDDASAPSSAVTKGWIYTGIGLVLATGGAAAAVYGARQANVANDLPLGHAQYDSYYQYAEQLTYAGYGSAGIGAASLIVGGMYLFGRDGLSRRAKGVYLLSAGTVAALVGTWLTLDSLSLAATANDLPSQDYRYDAAFAGASANWRAGLIAAGVGGVAALLGGYWLLTSSRSAAVADADQPLEFEVQPRIYRGGAGAGLSFRW